MNCDDERCVKCGDNIYNVCISGYGWLCPSCIDKIIRNLKGNHLNFKTIQCQILNELCNHGEMSKSKTAEVLAWVIVDKLL